MKQRNSNNGNKYHAVSVDSDRYTPEQRNKPNYLPGEKRWRLMTRPVITLFTASAMYLAASGSILAGPNGGIAEVLPQLHINDEMAAEGYKLSAGETNTQYPTTAIQFAVETDKPDEDIDVTNKALNLSNLCCGGGIDVPTGSKASPLFGALPFSQKMMRLEEFGPVPLGAANAATDGVAFPAPATADAFPGSQQLDDFLNQYVGLDQALPSPYPTRLANDPDNGGTDENPWKPEIEAFLQRPLFTPPAEGRPPGEHWAHQRWDEFKPEVYVNTAQTGARTNTGLRDRLQFHQYSVGEFGPGQDGISGTADDGLYHNTVGIGDQFNGTTKGIPVKFHPDLPVQDPQTLWTFDGTFPPKILQARYGESILMRHYNALPIDPSANNGFGLHTLSTHEHNGHNPAESDGYAQAFFFPGQYYDYRWPMVLAGHDSYGFAGAAAPAGNPRANAPADHSNSPIQGDPRETMSTHWFHDHMLDYTAPNVYKGNSAMMNYYSSIDRGNEAINDGVNLRLPSGTALNWGNRDYDINLSFADKAWDQNGQLFFNIFNLDGFLGDQLTTNMLWKPYLDVRARRYRLRLLNGSISRYLQVALIQQMPDDSGPLKGPIGSGLSYKTVPFHMIANDGNIMEHAVLFDGMKTVGGLENRRGILPTLGIAERYDIIVDFAKYAPGTKLYLVNLLEHKNGRRPESRISLENILNGTYHDRTTVPADQPVAEDGDYDTDPTVGRFLELRVQAYDGIDLSLNPNEYVEGKKKMIPLPGFTQAELDGAVHRSFDFARSGGTDTTPWTIKTDGGAGFNMDPRRLSAAPDKGNGVEIWHLEGNGGWSHPIHIHFEEGQIIKRDGVAPPEWEKWARKDVYRLGQLEDSGTSIDVAIRFREFKGTFMEHCHNTQHEDHAMLLRWDVENPGQVVMMPTPMPSWDGVGYVPTYALPTYKTGDLDAAEEASTNPDFGTLDVATPPPPPSASPGNELTGVDKARYSFPDDSWTVEGTSNTPDSGSTVTVYLGTGVSGAVIGSTTVDALGDWALEVDDSPVPLGSETTITIELSSGQVLTVEIEFEPYPEASISPDLGTLYVATAPPPPSASPGNEIVEIDKARYSFLDVSWRIEGTSNTPDSGSTVTVYLGTGVLGPVIGSTTVDALGEWELKVEDSPVLPGSETTITIELSSGQVVTVAIEFEP